MYALFLWLDQLYMGKFWSSGMSFVWQEVLGFLPNNIRLARSYKLRIAPTGAPGIRLSAEVRRIEQLWQTLCSGQLLASNIHSIFILINRITGKLAVLLVSIFLKICSCSDFHLPTWGNTCTTLYFSRFGTESLKWLVMAPLLYTLESEMDDRTLWRKRW